MPFRPVGDPPGRDKVCDGVKSALLRAFPPKLLETHFRSGYSFRSDPCTTAFAYDPDFCVPGAIKTDPEHYGPEKDAVVGMIQSAFSCTYGASLDDLHHEVEATILNNLWRAIEADLVADLLAFPAVSQTPAPLQAVCALAEATQFLASQGNCGKGIIVGPYDWFVQLSTQNLIWNGTYHTDLVGNLVIPLSLDTDTVYAFDSNVDIRTSPVDFLEELAPGVRTVNDRVFRAEQIYTVGIDPCIVGSFDVSGCCGCSSGGGGGPSTSVAVTNFPAVQPVSVAALPPVTVSNFPANQTVTVSNFPAPDVDDPLVSLITVASHQFDVVSGSPWTPAAVPAGRLVGLSHTVVVDTVTVLDSDSTVIAGIPAGFTQDWSVNDDRETLTPVTSITADSATARSIVTMVVASP